MRPDWSQPMGPPQAWTQGLLLGAGLALMPMVLQFAGEVLLFVPAVAILLLFAVGIPAGLVDLARGRRSVDWRITAPIVASTLAVAALAVDPWGAEALRPDAGLLLLPPLAFLLGADRFASRGLAAWRDRSLAAACGYAAAWPFMVDAHLPAWALTGGSALAVAALLLPRLPGKARLVLVVLAAFPALSLGAFLDATVVRRTAEWSAFLGYALLSLLAWRRDREARPAAPVPAAPLRADP